MYSEESSRPIGGGITVSYTMLSIRRLRPHPINFGVGIALFVHDNKNKAKTVNDKDSMRFIMPQS